MLISAWLNAVRSRLQSPQKVSRRVTTRQASAATEGLEPRTLLTTTLQAVRPNVGEFFVQNEVRNIAPQELTLQFSLGSTITPASITSKSIEVFRSGGPNALTGIFGDGNDVPVSIGYVGPGSVPNEVILRFGENLVDEHYRIVVHGTGANKLSATVVTAGGPVADPVTDGTFDFELDLGARILAVEPQPITRLGNGTLSQARDTVVLYLNNDDLKPSSAQNTSFYQLIFTNDTVTSLDDVIHNPTSAVYDSAADTVTLKFASDIALLSGAGSYRLRVGNAESLPQVPVASTPGADPGSSFATANNSIGTPSAAINSTRIISSAISPQLLALPFPGAGDEPGHREIEVENHLGGGADSGASGIPVIDYNFQDVYGSYSGNVLHNLITEAQKDRAREIFAYYGAYAGIDFRETVSSGLTIVTGDLRALDPTIPTGPGGVAGLAGGGTAIMDMAETWSDVPGGSWFGVATHEIGHLLGQGHTYDLPAPTVQGSGSSGSVGTNVEPTALGDNDIVHIQYQYRPDSIDIDLYKFTVSADSAFSAEIMAERQANSSSLDSVLRLYREVGGVRELIAQNDNYFSKDSFLELSLQPGVYYIGVSSTGNDAYDPTIADSGIGGTSQGAYDLRVNFRPNVSGVGSTIVDTTDRAFDGDGDGIERGVYNFWFKAASAANTLIVDKATVTTLRTAASAATTQIGVQQTTPYAVNDVIRIDNEQMKITAINAGTKVLTVTRAFNATFAASHSVGALIRKMSATGQLAAPFGYIGDALSIATPGQIVRIVGNGGADNNISTIADNLPYEIGQNSSNQSLADGVTVNNPNGTSLEVPMGVTVMIDPGAVFKLRRGWIGVGSSTASVDRSGNALQVLGVPGRQVVFTDWQDETIGTDTTPSPTAPIKGDWGGIIFRNDVDRAQNRFNAEDEGIFLNYVGYSDIRYGGGPVTIDGNTQTINPVHMDRSQPTVTYNTIQFSNDSAMSADPDSFEELTFHSPRFQTGKPAFAVDYKRVGPDIHWNTLLQNGNNALNVRIDTLPGGATQNMSVPGRFDDTDIVYLVSQNLELQGTPSGAYVESVAPSVTLVTVNATVGGALAAGTYNYRIAFTDENGFESPASAVTTSAVLAAAGSITLAQLPPANGPYTGRRLYRSQNTGGGTYTLIADLDKSATSYVDAGKTLTRTLNLATAFSPHDRARLDARLSIDPGIIVKLQGSRIQVDMGAQLIAEGVSGHQVIFTSRLDDRYGAGGTFDTNNDDTQAVETTPSAGNWGGLYISQLGSVSIDRAYIAYGGGSVPVGSGFGSINPIEIHEAKARIRFTTFENNAGGGPAGSRTGLFPNAQGTIFAVAAQPVILDNIFVNNAGPVVNINVNALNKLFVTDVGRSTGLIDQQLSYGDNQGPLIRDNVLDGNGHNGMVVRGETVTTQSIWDDTDIVHILLDEVYIPNMHTYGGVRLESSSTESLVVKLSGASAGFTAGGSTADVTDRIGGMLHIIGQPGQPVILTSLSDDTAGAGFDLQGLLQKDTNGNGASTGSAGDWRGINIDRYAHDRNVAVYVENEIADRFSADTNSTVPEVIGSLAEKQAWGDENLRLGVDLQGLIDNPSDVDVYSFSGVAGSQVWIDIDRTTHSLDTVVELLDSTGKIIAQSDNYLAEKLGTWSLFTASSSVLARGLDYSPYLSDDHYTTNPRDAGFRIVLPGTDGLRGTYFIRVRSSNIDSTTAAPRTDLQDLSKVTNGLTSGVYQLQLRLQEEDEFAGTTVQFADIRFATTGINVTGQPIHSPLAGESEETEGQTGQLGNVMDADRGALAVRGTVGSTNDVDFYQFEVNYTHTQQIGGVSLKAPQVPVVFDLDYADGVARADMTMAIYDSQGRLILIGRDSNIADDQPGPVSGSNTDDLSRGSVGIFDPFVGAVELPGGIYTLAVTNNRQVPQGLDQFYTATSSSPLLRVEPVNSVNRIAEERFTSGDNDLYTAANQPVTNLFNVSAGGVLDPKHVVPYNLGNVVLFVSVNGGLKGNDETTVETLNPFTGELVTALGSFGTSVGDIAMRPDGGLFTFTTSPAGTGESTSGVTGNYLRIDTGTAATTNLGDDGVTTNRDNTDTNGVPQPGDNNVVDANAGMIYNGMTFTGTGDKNLYAVGNRANVTPPANSYLAAAYTTNVLYRFDIRTGAVDGVPIDRINDNRAFGGAGTTQREIGQIPAAGTVTGLASIAGQMYAVDSLGNLYRVSTATAATTFVANMGTSFTSLVAGPDEVEGGKYATTLFAMDTFGNLMAFNTAGVAQPVFFDGQSTIATGVPGSNGLAFSTLDRNLWATTTNRGDDLGHGVETRFDDSILANRQPGGRSLYFGNQRTGAAQGNQNDLATGVVRNVNFPGGADGSIISNAFSLEGYSKGDKPALYFNYFLETENAAWNPLTSATTLMRDSFRVFASDASGEWNLVSTNDSYRDPAQFDEFDYGPDGSLTAAPTTQTFPDVVETFDNTGTWRQARIDLSNFAGRGELRLRFDFSTAGSMNLGDTFTTGSELRAISGAKLRDGDTFVIDGIAFEFDMGATLVAPSGATAIGESFTVGGQTFNFSATPGGPNTIVVSATSTPAQVAASVTARINAVLGGGSAVLPAGPASNRVTFTGRSVTFASFGLRIEGAAGITGNRIVSVTPAMSADAVAVVMRQAMADEFSAGDIANIKGSAELVWVIGHDVTDPGPLGFADNLPGDAVGAFKAGFQNGVANRPGSLRGMNNAVEGVYIDDIIIGLAERGEMVINAPATTGFIANQDINENNYPAGNTYQGIDLGAYDVEIRRTTDYAMTVDVSPTNALYNSIDTNDRIGELASITVPDSWQLVDGSTMTISDGVNRVIFEFNQVGGATTTQGSFPIPFDPALGEDSITLAARLRDAINSVTVQNVLKVKAALSDGADVGFGSTSHTLHLTGNAIVTVSPEIATALSVIVYQGYGDQNHDRDQGQLIVRSSFVTNSSGYGIASDASDRAGGTLPGAGSVRNLVKINGSRLVTGVVIMDNVIAGNVAGGIRFSGDQLANPLGQVPYGRIVNNTIVGIGSGNGILVEQTASPTILNNIVADFTTGLNIDGSSQGAGTTIGATLYRGNGTNSTGGLGAYPIILLPSDPLFVNQATGNYYLAPGSQAIDSSVTSLGDRNSLLQVKDPLDLDGRDNQGSPIIAPEFDVYGQLRGNDPDVETPGSQGASVTFDRGAIDRVDFSPPQARLVVPEDQSSQDGDPDVNEVWIDQSQVLRQFRIRLIDEGIGIDHTTVNKNGFVLKRIAVDGVTEIILVEGVDYQFVYNEITREAIFNAATFFADENTEARYIILVDNDGVSVGDTVNGVRDLAGNYLLANRADGTTRFDIVLTDGVNDPPVNTVPLTTQTILEDTTLVFNQANGNAISIFDQDAHLGTNVLTVTLTATNGVLTLGSIPAGLTFAPLSGDGTADITMTFTGKLQEINTALAGLRFIPDQDYFGAASLTILTNDLGEFSGPPAQDTDVIAIDVTPVNDVPFFNTLSNPAAIDEDAVPVAVAIPNFITGQAAGPANESSQVLTALVTVQSENSAWTTLTFFAVAPAINAVTGTLTFTVAQDVNGTATIRVVLRDNGTPNAFSVPQTFVITVNAVNDSPVFTPTTTDARVDVSGNITTLEDAGLQTITYPASFAAGRPTALDEVGAQTPLVWTVSGPTLVTGNLNFTQLTVDPVTGVLRYNTTQDTAGSATVVLTLTDAGSNTAPNVNLATRTVTINVRQVNDAPVAVTGNYVVDEGYDLNLDASASFDVDAFFGDTITKYEWDLDNNGTWETDALASAMTTITWATLSSLGITAPSVRTIRLRVTDNSVLANNKSITTATLNTLIVDYGDAPDTYGTLRPGGAAHTIANGLFLGTGVTKEPNGKPSPLANLDTDDGVAFPTYLETSPTIALPAFVDVTVSAAGKLDVWLDKVGAGFGAFDVSEKLNGGVSYVVAAGLNRINFTIPAGTPIGDSVMRFRVSTAGSLAATGRANDGEVEDYAVKIRTLQNAITPTINGPATPTTDLAPTVTWTQHPENFNYDLVVKNSLNVVVFTRLNTSFNFAQITPPLPAGIYTSTVTAYNKAGTAAPAATRQFEIIPPIITSPTGSVPSVRPQVTWNAVNGAATYRVELFNRTDNAVVSTVSGITATNWTPAADLLLADYRVTVTAFNSLGQTTTAAVRTFTVAPNVPVVQFPTGRHADATPTFSWNAVPGANRYELVVRQKWGTFDIVVNQSNLTTTFFTQPTSLGLGRYTYQVRAINDPSNLSATAPVFSNAFTTYEFVNVESPVLIGPELTTFSSNPKIEWISPPNSEKSDIWINKVVDSVGGRVVFLQKYGVTGTSYTANDKAFGIGTYIVWVRTYSNTDNPATTTIDEREVSNWSIQRVIRVSTPPTLIGPAGRTPVAKPTLTWQSVLGASSYEIWIDNNSVPVKNLFAKLTPNPNTGLTALSYTVPENLPIGQYTFWVRARTSFGFDSNWSLPKTFSVTAWPTLTGPSSSTFDTTPTFNWTDMKSTLGGLTAGAARYDFRIYGIDPTTKQYVELPQYTVTTLTTSTYTIPADKALPAGNYRAYVRGIANGRPTAGVPETVSDFSFPLPFYVGGIPVVTTLPSTTSTTPTLLWQSVDGASGYEVFLSTSALPSINLLSSLNNKTGGTSFVVPQALTKGVYRYWIRAFNASTGTAGAWSARQTLTIVDAGDAGSDQLQNEPTEFVWTVVPGLVPQTLVTESAISMVPAVVDGSQYLPLAAEVRNPNADVALFEVENAANAVPTTAGTAATDQTDSVLSKWDEQTWWESQPVAEKPAEVELKSSTAGFLGALFALAPRSLRRRKDE